MRKIWALRTPPSAKGGADVHPTEPPLDGVDVGRVSEQLHTGEGLQGGVEVPGVVGMGGGGW